MHRCRKIMLHEFYSTSCWTEGIVIDATYGLDGNGIVLRPQAEALIDVLCQERPAGPAHGRASVVPIPAPMGGVHRCPTRTPTRPASMTGNATAGSPKSASPKACAPNAEESPFLPTVVCAAPAARSGARPSAPGTPRARPPAGSTEAGIPRTAAGSGGREAGSASGHAGPPACARDAGTVPPVPGGATCRACRDARQAAEQEQYAARQGRGTVRQVRKIISLTTPRAAIPARLSRPGAIHGRTRPAEGATPIGVRGGVARTVANPLRERRGACRARTGPGCGRAGIGAFRSFRLATP